MSREVKGTLPPPVPCASSLSCVRLLHPVDRHLPGSSVHGILQARMLEWVAVKEYACDHMIYRYIDYSGRRQ